MNDPSIPVRQAIIKALQESAAITSLVPASRCYPPRTPAKPVWPWLQYGQAIFTPQSANCLDIGTVAVRIHAFASGGDEAAAAIGAAVMALLAGSDNLGLSLSLGDGRTATVQPQQSQTIPDGTDAANWHCFVTLRVQVTR